MNIRKQTLEGASRNIARLNTAIDTVKRTDTQRLQVCSSICDHAVPFCLQHVQQELWQTNDGDVYSVQNEYQRLLSGLRQQGALPGVGNDEGAMSGKPLPAGNDWLATPQVPADILQEAVRRFPASSQISVRPNVYVNLSRHV